ncbi:leukocyte elastase inhibitor B-like [Penaeus japonicus]|uniref:leukocyte elastase inhibitor B-like n=1 Tax=Penaeus japonicus TaxID=27405 RepID=UPI001C7118AC|nr:leukocyte elastase inhibitor B-like [Penaeus japonicus]
MIFAAVGVVVATLLGLVQPQCLTSRDDFSVKVNTDLSAVTDFGFDLYRRLDSPSSTRNFFFSPFSIWSAFILPYLGSAGETEAQLQRALQVDGKVVTFKIWRALQALYQTSNSDYTFNIANRAYIDNVLPIRPCITEILDREIERVNFRDVSSVVNQINNFASVNTKGRITDLVSFDDILDAHMAIVNAAYFKGTWQFQFKPTSTVSERFFVTPQRHQMVPMMSQVGSFGYGEFDQIAASVLELPYTGVGVSMFLFLPAQEGPQGFANMVSRLSGNNLRASTHKKNLRKQNVDVKLPKFRMELKISDELIPALNDMGIVDIFNSEKVDLTTFGNLRNLTLDKVIHKAFVEVNEEGTEAAAATALIFVTRASRADTPAIFHCNRPFLFLIRDNETNNNLFMGAYRNPETARS